MFNQRKLISRLAWREISDEFSLAYNSVVYSKSLGQTRSCFKNQTFDFQTAILLNFRRPTFKFIVLSSSWVINKFTPTTPAEMAEYDNFRLEW